MERLRLIIGDEKNLSPEIGELMEAEHRHQLNKHGIQYEEATEWLAYLTEEVGELSKAILDHNYQGGDPQKVRDEAAQVMTLAAKMATCPFYLPKNQETPQSSS